MPNYLARIFTAANQQPFSAPNKHLPMINSLAASYSTYLTEFGQVRKKKQLMAWIKAIPELTALINKISKDIVYKYHFEPVKPGESGRNKVLKANRFAAEVKLKKLMRSQMFDNIGLGESFGWMGKISEKAIKEAIKKRLDNEFISRVEKKEIEKKIDEGIRNTTGIDEDLLAPRKYRYVASSSMEIVYNQYDIDFYKQWVGVWSQEFKPEEIIHFTQIDVDGKVNGFTPVESIIVQLELLRQMWQNLLSIHKNGGAPDRAFILEDTKVNTDSYKRIEDQLMKYKLVENRHGNLLFTGKLKIEDLTQFDKMQFMDSGLYITGVMAMQWEVPRSSIPFIVGEANTKEDVGGNAERGYWRNIEFMQDDFAETMNSQLWIPHFGVKIVFDNSYVQQDIQVETAKQLRLGNVQTIENLAHAKEKQIKFEKFVDMVGLNEEHFEEYEAPMMEVGAGSTMNNQLSRSEVNDSDAKKNESAKKKAEQESSIASRGSEPSGVGKEKKSRFKTYPYIF